MKKRILLIGFDIPPFEVYNRKTEEHEFVFKPDDDEHIYAKYYRKSRHYPTLYDYKLVIIHSTPTETFKFEHLKNRQDEFQKFFSMGGVLVIISNYIPSDLFSKEIPEVIMKRGEVVRASSKHPFYTLLKKYQFKWRWHLKNRERFIKTIATNEPGDPIAFEMSSLSGKIFFLPGLKKVKRDGIKFLRATLNLIKSRYFYQKVGDIEKPNWISKYLLPNEKSIQTTYEQSKLQLDEFEKIRAILYTYGKQLSSDVNYLLNKMGLKTQYTENTGKHDIEMQLNGVIGIIEVKGLKGYTNIDDVRQLLDYVIAKIKEKSGKDIKGIFILNHFREKDLKDRKDPFTVDAIKLAERNQFCLMTTTELFEIFKKFLKKEIDTDFVIKKIIETIGRIKL